MADDMPTPKSGDYYRDVNVPDDECVDVGMPWRASHVYDGERWVRVRLPRFPWNSTHRLEWIRFLIACLMVVTVLAEFLLLWAFNWYSLWVWLAIIAVQGFALHRMTKIIGRERQRAFEDWMAEFDQWVLRMREMDDHG